MTVEQSYEVLDPRFKRLVKTDSPVQKLWTGGLWVEGPVYNPLYRSVFWSDIPNDRRLRLDELTGTVGTYHQDKGFYVNGSTLDRQGRIICCEHGRRCVSRIEHDGRVTILASHYQGKRLNSPNDVVVKSDGSIWFTDPAYGIESDYEGYAAEQEQDGENVYCILPDTGDLICVADDFSCPNGLAFSPDESLLYIVDSGGTRYPSGEKHIRVFDVSDQGKLSGGQVISECENGFYDGFRLDNKGRLWTSAEDGVHCLTDQGELIGKIYIPEPVSNLCFGGPKGNRLYITATSSLYSVLIASTGVKLF